MRATMSRRHASAWPRRRRAGNDLDTRTRATLARSSASTLPLLIAAARGGGVIDHVHVRVAPLEAARQRARRRPADSPANYHHAAAAGELQRLCDARRLHEARARGQLLRELEIGRAHV